MRRALVRWWRDAGRARVMAATPAMTRRLLGDGGGGRTASLAAALARRVASGTSLGAPDAHTRHALVPAALRIERSRSRGRRGEAEQVAVTLWFGDGPTLPAPGAGGATARALRLGAGLAGAAAVAVLGSAAARVAAEQQRPSRLVSTEPPRRIGPPAG